MRRRFSNDDRVASLITNRVDDFDMSVKEQFEAAVAVIQNLPKDGPYQPSYSMQTKFYGLYKQATVGPCNIAKPGFWDVVGRAKYHSWQQYGDMSKEEAMHQYVEGLKQVGKEVLHANFSSLTF